MDAKTNPRLASLGSSSAQTPLDTRSPLGLLSSTASTLDPLPASTTTTSATGKGSSSVTREGPPGTPTPLGKQSRHRSVSYGLRRNLPARFSVATPATATPLGTQTLGSSSTQTPLGTQTSSTATPLGTQTPLGKQSHCCFDPSTRELSPGSFLYSSFCYSCEQTTEYSSPGHAILQAAQGSCFDSYDERPIGENQPIRGKRPQRENGGLRSHAAYSDCGPRVPPLVP